jgi:hypothetical protein
MPDIRLHVVLDDDSKIELEVPSGDVKGRIDFLITHGVRDDGEGATLWKHYPPSRIRCIEAERI